MGRKTKEDEKETIGMVVKEKTRVVVKGYMRPDGTSYYVSIPKQIRDILDLKGGEYFVMKAEKGKQKIKLKLVEFADEGSEEE